jgi:ech hydrogenase subunit C
MKMKRGIKQKTGLKDKIMNYARMKSPWILHLDVGGCNGCSIELFATLSPRYDIERFGGLSKNNPRHSDILLIDGAISRKIAPRLRRIYEQTPEPKVVVAVGGCAITKGIFHDSYNIVGPLDRIMPVDVYVPGCPPKPEAILHGLLKGIEVWKGKSAQAQPGRSSCSQSRR